MNIGKQNFNVDEMQGFKIHESLADGFDFGFMPHQWEIVKSTPCLMDEM